MILLEGRKEENMLEQQDNSFQLETSEDVANKFKSGEYFVSVFGLGHVGAPIASAWLRSGVTVLG
ncbi:MAG: hypothetical protein M3162_03850, partial [Thermoproteota archaeon]|nr:hypothetical protein [Thermoproteota archaeon]